MGKPLMIQEEDDLRINQLKDRIKAKSKVDVVRKALTLLEDDLLKLDRIQRWEKAAKIVGSSGLENLKEFQTKSRFKNLP